VRLFNCGKLDWFWAEVYFGIGGFGGKEYHTFFILEPICLGGKTVKSMLKHALSFCIYGINTSISIAARRVDRIYSPASRVTSKYHRENHSATMMAVLIRLAYCGLWKMSPFHKLNGKSATPKTPGKSQALSYSHLREH
jgi:hypothetical protein